MKRKLLALITSILLLCTMIPLGAVSASATTSGGTTEDGLKYTVSGGEVTITGHTDDLPADVFIPSTIEGYPVTTIWNYAFYECDILTSIAIPNSISHIWEGAFVGCRQLTDVYYAGFEADRANITIDGWGNGPFCNATWHYRYYFASIEVYDGLEYGILDDEVTITGYTGDLPSDLTIPAIIKGYPVTIIGESAFDECSSLTSVTIPDSVTTIRDDAFRDCNSLTDVTIGTGVIFVGDNAFYGCRYLRTVRITDIVAWCAIDFIGADANPLCGAREFYLDGVLVTDLVIPDSVTSFDNWAFYGCDALTSVTIGSGVTSIGEYAFHDCSYLTSVAIGSGVASIGEDAFSNCTYLTAIIVDDKNPTYCSVDGVLFDKSCTVLMQCPGRKSGNFTIPASVTSIAESAFSGCKSLISVAIPDGVTTIREHTFSNCSSLLSVTLPASVTAIRESAFAASRQLTDVYYTGSEEDRANMTIDGWGNDPLLNATWHYNYFNQPEVYSGLKYGIADGAVTITGYTDGLPANLTIPDTIEGYPVTTIRESAFYGCTVLTSVTIPSSVTFIGRYAFSCCSALPFIAIPDSITTIDEGAFEDCYSLTSIAIPVSVTTIAKDAFSSCYQLTDVYYAGSEEDRANMDIDEWNNSALLNATWCYNCFVQGGLMYEIADGEITITGTTDDLPADLVIPSTIKGYPVTTIGDSAFYGCDSLVSVLIPDGVTSLGERAFYDCFSLTEITLPDSVTSIGSSAFYNCSSLSSITLPDSITSIGAQAFDGTAYSMNADNWDNGALYIGNHLIHGPFLSGEYVIRDGTKTIASEAFYERRDLTSVVIPDGVTTIGAWAFTSCYSLTSVTIPRSVTVIEGRIFGWADAQFINVYYDGYRTDRDAIAIDAANGILFNAKWHYTPCPENEHVYAFPCDECCNRCEQLRTPEAAHNGDASCTVCGKTFLEYEIADGEVAIIGCSNDLKGHYVIPDTIEGYPVTALWDGALYGCYITGLTLPVHLREFSPWAIYNIPTIETIEVSKDNAYFCVVDGALYSKDMTALLYIPSAKNITSYTVPDGVETIEHLAFSHFQMDTLYLPASVTYLGDGNIGENTQIYYGGSEEDWENVSIDWMFNGGGGNIIHYNYALVCNHVYNGDADPDCNLCGVTRWVVCSDTDVIVSGKDSGVTLPADTVVSVEQVAMDSIAPDLSVLDDPNVELITVYDIALTVDGVRIQPNGMMSVTLPIPTDAGTYTDLQVVYVDDAGNVTPCETVVNGDGTVTFFTDHFSCYAIVGVSAVILGDANGDGKVNNRDLGLFQQHLNDWDVTIELAACDLNDDGRVNNRDLGILQQYINEWDVTLGK